MIISKCSDCNHRDICKYREDYDKIAGSIAVNIPEPFMLILNCKYYYSTHTYLNSCDTYPGTNSYFNCSNSVMADKNILEAK